MTGSLRPTAEKVTATRVTVSAQQQKGGVLKQSKHSTATHYRTCVERPWVVASDDKTMHTKYMLHLRTRLLTPWKVNSHFILPSMTKREASEYCMEASNYQNYKPA